MLMGIKLERTNLLKEIASVEKLITSLEQDIDNFHKRNAEGRVGWMASTNSMAMRKSQANKKLKLLKQRVAEIDAGQCESSLMKDICEYALTLDISHNEPNLIVGCSKSRNRKFSIFINSALSDGSVEVVDSNNQSIRCFTVDEFRDLMR